MIKVKKNSFERKKIIKLNPVKPITTKNLKIDIEEIFSKQLIADVPVALSLSGE